MIKPLWVVGGRIEMGAVQVTGPISTVVDEKGVLCLEGYYTSRPSTTYFEMELIRENQEWKLLGIGLELK
jgi:hypothetical protein